MTTATTEMIFICACGHEDDDTRRWYLLDGETTCETCALADGDAA